MALGVWDYPPLVMFTGNALCARPGVLALCRVGRPGRELQARSVWLGIGHSVLAAVPPHTREQISFTHWFPIHRVVFGLGTHGWPSEGIYS